MTSKIVTYNSLNYAGTLGAGLVAKLIPADMIALQAK